MDFLDSETALAHRYQNRLQTVLIIAGMTLLAGLCGELLLGEGTSWWVATAVVVMLITTPRIPTWRIMYLYGARPLERWEAPELERLTETLATRAGLPAPPRLYYLPSAAMNAFTVGGRGDSAVAVTDGLLRRLTLREVAGVLGHEISHVAHHDIQVMGLADTVSRLTGVMSTLGLLLALLALPLWLLGLASLSFTGIILLLFAPTLSALLQAGLSRTREFNADLGAAELTGDPRGLASALAKLEYPGHPWWRRFFVPQGGESAPSSLRSHPPTEARIQRLLELAPRRRHSVVPTAAPPVRSLLTPGVVVVTRRPRRHWSGLWY